MSLVMYHDNVDHDILQSSTAATKSSAAAVNPRRRRSGLYLGSKDDAKDSTKLEKAWNVTHILNMTPAKEVNVQVSKNGESQFCLNLMCVAHTSIGWFSPYLVLENTRRF